MLRSWKVPTQRRRVAEVMDQPGLDQNIHRQALQGLRRLNRWSGAVGSLWPVLRDLATRAPDREVRVLDLATGGGDVPICLGLRARRAGRPVRLAGCDASVTALELARAQAAAAGVPLEFFPHDVLAQPLPEGYDILMCSLFLHHLAEEQAVELLRQMKAAARLGILVNDLVRSPLNRALVFLGSRLLTRSPVVHTDALRSVEAAFTLAEVRDLAQRAGLDGAWLRSRFPCRFVLSWERP